MEVDSNRDLYDSILREGRNNNSEIAIRIRESAESVFEFLENLNTNKKF